MLRQTAVAGGASAGSSRAFRLDPFVLPIRYSAYVGGGRPAKASVYLDKTGAIVTGSVAGRSEPIYAPLGEFEGVSVRMTTIGDTGAVRAVVELRHSNAALTLPLVVADEPEDVAADWKAWSRALKLPLLIVGNDGKVIRAASDAERIPLLQPKPRRRHSYFAARRPRFLTRRKTGRGGPRPVIEAREIIART